LFLYVNILIEHLKAKLREEIFVPLFEKRFLPILTGKLKESSKNKFGIYGLSRRPDGFEMKALPY
jgi:hypothetical protein